MTILRIYKKQNNFVILDKTCLYYEKLSWGAKGLHAFLISMPHDWRVRVNDLQKRATNGRDAVRAFLNELESAGYIKKSRRRNNDTGRFDGMEYLVFETPDQEIEPNSPSTENPSSAKNEPEIPQSENPPPETPSAGNPSTGKATLLNNNLVNNKINNKTAAANISTDNQNLPADEIKAAAVNFSHKEVEKNLPSSIQQRAQVHVLPNEDALIGEILTPNQVKRVSDLVEKFDVQNKEQLALEIQYCLLNKNHFTLCGKDFSKKLNSIRLVILRGDWQTPAGMFVQGRGFAPSKLHELQQKLLEAKRAETHFTRLLGMANEAAKPNLAELVGKEQQKITEIEDFINQVTTADNVEAISC